MTAAFASDKSLRPRGRSDHYARSPSVNAAESARPRAQQLSVANEFRSFLTFLALLRPGTGALRPAGMHCRARAQGVGLALMCLAIPGKITSITGDDPLTRMGKIDFGGILKEASLAYVPEAKVGDYVIVHVGFALSRVDEDEAQQGFRVFAADGGTGRAGQARCEQIKSRPNRTVRVAMKYLDEYRDAEPRRSSTRAKSPASRPGLEHHGGLRRPDACHRQVRH